MKKLLPWTATLLMGIMMLQTGCSRKVIAMEEGWDLLGSTKVNFVRDRDDIEVANRVLYTAIRFRVEDRDIRINYIRIQFDNGDRLEPAIDEVIAAGQSSRIIQLGEQGRYIDRIEFRYRTTGSVLRGRAEVYLFGRRYYAGY